MRRTFSIISLVLGSILLFHASLAVYVERQLLDNKQWSETSIELLQNPDVRSEVSVYLVDQIYANVDVSNELKKALPEQFSPLSGLLAGGLRNLADKGVDQLLSQPQIQSIWGEANSATHSTLVDFLEGNTGALDASNGKVTLDLRTLAQEVGQNFGIDNLQDRLPPDAANLQIASSSELESAQTAVRVLKGTAFVLSLLVVALFALYLVLATNRRRAVAFSGLAFIIVAILILITRSVSGNTLVGQVVTDPSIKPAAASAWSIVTDLMRDQAWALVFYGAIAIAGSLLAGPSSAAVSIRKTVAPWALKPVVAWVFFGVVILLLFAWAPVEGFRHLWTCLLFVIATGIGFEFLRRQTAREFPKAKTPDWGATGQRLRQRASGWGDDLRGKARNAKGAAARPRGGRRARKATEARLDEIERLQKLKKSGAITTKEFAAEKKRLLGG